MLEGMWGPKTTCVSAFLRNDLVDPFLVPIWYSKDFAGIFMVRSSARLFGLGKRYDEFENSSKTTSLCIFLQQIGSWKYWPNHWFYQPGYILTLCIWKKLPITGEWLPIVLPTHLFLWIGPNLTQHWYGFVQALSVTYPASPCTIHHLLDFWGLSPR